MPDGDQAEGAVGVRLDVGHLDAAADPEQRLGAVLADLVALADADRAEVPLVGVDPEQVVDQRAVTVLEDVERHADAREQHRVQREHRQRGRHGSTLARECPTDRAPRPDGGRAAPRIGAMMRRIDLRGALCSRRLPRGRAPRGLRRRGRPARRPADLRGRARPAGSRRSWSCRERFDGVVADDIARAAAGAGRSALAALDPDVRAGAGGVHPPAARVVRGRARERRGDTTSAVTPAGPPSPTAWCRSAASASTSPAASRPSCPAW